MPNPEKCIMAQSKTWAPHCITHHLFDLSTGMLRSKMKWSIAGKPSIQNSPFPDQ